MEGQVVRDIPICSLYSRLYHLSSPKNHSLTLILGHLDLLSSPSLGFHCSFINRETTNVSASFSFSPLFTLCLGGEIPAFRSHVLWKVILVTLYSISFPTHPWWGVLFFSLLGRWKFPRRLSSFCGKCFLEELTPWIESSLGRGSLVVEPLCCILSRGWNLRTWNISCGAVSCLCCLEQFLSGVWLLFYQPL